jgi:hypothetical protein
MLRTSMIFCTRLRRFYLSAVYFQLNSFKYESRAQKKFQTCLKSNSLISHVEKCCTSPILAQIRAFVGTQPWTFYMKTPLLQEKFYTIYRQASHKNNGRNAKCYELVLKEKI